MGKRIMTLSPGSTSTKIAVFEEKNQIFKTNVRHDPEKLNSFSTVMEQYPYRIKTILAELEKHEVLLSSIDAFAAYSGGLEPSESGIFPVNEKMIEDSLSGKVNHPAVLGAALIRELAEGKPCYVVNPPDSDEFDDLARITGLKGIYRECRIHVLSQKEAARRYCISIGKKQEECNLIVAHIGGGLSVSAQRHGRIIDGNDVLNGSGPMAPNRSGSIPAMEIVKMCFGGKYTEKEMRNLIGKTGGLLNHLGTDDTREIKERIHNGSTYAKLIYDAMAYQTAKEIAGYAAVLEGRVDGIVLTGGVVNDECFVNEITKRVDWIAPVRVYGGDFEMEALCAGALSALDGTAVLKEYTGIPVFMGFDEKT